MAAGGRGLAAEPQQPLSSENPGDWHLHDLLAQITTCIAAKPSEMPPSQWGEASCMLVCTYVYKLFYMQTCSYMCTCTHVRSRLVHIMLA